MVRTGLYDYDYGYMEFHVEKNIGAFPNFKYTTS